MDAANTEGVLPFFDGSSLNNPIKGYGGFIRDGNWHHLVTYNAESTTYVYVDGDLVGSNEESYTSRNSQEIRY